MTIIQSITLAIALLGAVLGVINTWHALDRLRVKLRVVPKTAHPFGYGAPDIDFCIEITNLSSFAVYISEAGLLFSGTTNKAAIINPVFSNEIDGSWPKKLEPRESKTVYFKLTNLKAEHKVTSVYVKTQCDVKKVVKNKMMQNILDGK